MSDLTEFKDRYPSLSSLGLTSQHLLAVVDDSDCNDIEALHIPTPKVTNQLILELYNFMNRNSSCTFYILWRWMLSLLSDECEKDGFPTVKSIRQSVVRLSARLSTLKKMPSSGDKFNAIDKFLNHPYTLPRVFVSHSKVITTSSSDEYGSCTSCNELKAFIKESKKKLYAAHRNGQKRVKRRDNLIKQQKGQLKEDKQIIDNLQRQAEQVDVLKAKVDRLRHRASYWRSKYDEIHGSSNDEVAKVELDCHQQQEKLREEIRQLEYDNVELRDEVKHILSENNEKITTFQGGKYTDDIRACCYELLSLNVSVNNVKAVIESVLTNIAHKEVERLPKRTAMCEMMIECITLAQAQLGERLSQDDGQYNTLQTDGTTKHGEHFSTFDVATASETYSLGLRHVFSGSAQSTLDTLIEILDDLDVVRKEMGESSVSAIIVSKMKNTMSDRHSAEKLFSTILSDYRASILPDVVKGWEEMTDSEREHITRMNNFFCGLHYLVGLAESAEETLKLWEETHSEDDVQSRKCSGTQTLIRTACKAFHHRGSEQAGCSTHFRTYLRQKGILKIPLASFVGNRFNIVFYDAAGVFYLKSHMLDYLMNYHGTSLNRLLQAVLQDLKSPLYIAGCKALGIIDKLVTGPFWRFLQTSTVSILQMSTTYTKMRDLFEKWSGDAQVVLDNETLLFPDHTSFQDEVMDLLYKETESDHLVLELLQLLFKSFVLTSERLLIDHLPGGEHHSVTDSEIISETSSVPKTNVAPERDFARLDRLMTQKPNASFIALEATILFSQNKTSNWLKEKSEEERERLLQAARKLSKVHRKNFKERSDEIKAKRLELLLQKERELSTKRKKELKEKEDLTLKVQTLGLWTTAAEIEHHLNQLKTKKSKIEALKVQINFRRKVLNQLNSKHLFQFSHNHRALTVEQLQSNLVELLLPVESSDRVPSDQEIERDPELLLYRRVKHLFNVDGVDTWYTGTVISYDNTTKDFRVAYDNEDEVFSFPLIEDLKSGDLEIVS